MSSPTSVEAKPTLQAASPTPPAQTQEAKPVVSSTLTERIDQVGKSLEKSLSNTERSVAIFAFAETLRMDEFKAAIASTATSKNLRGTEPSLFGFWMERDLPNALAWYETLDGTEKAKFSSTLLQTWSVMDPRAALTWLENQPEAERLSLAKTGQSILAQYAGPIEPDRVLALLTTIEGDSGMIGRIRDGNTFSTGGNWSGTYIFFWSLGEKAPADAAARALRLPSGTNRTSAALAVAKVWAAKDPIAAKAWAEKIDDAALAAQVIPACAIGLAEKDPKQAAEWLGEMSATLPNREGMKEVMAVWGRKDIEGALAWLDSLPEDSGAEDLTTAVFKTLGDKDPDRVLKGARQRLDAGKPFGWDWRNYSLDMYAHLKGYREALRIAEKDFQHPDSYTSLEIYSSLVNGAAQENPSETAAWALQQPGGDRRRRALRVSSSSLLYQDQEAAFRWIDALPNDEDSDDARVEGAERLFKKQPDKAAALYAGMVDRNNADQTLMGSVFNALAEKAPGISEWLDKTTSLSPAQKAEIRKAVNSIKE